MNVRTGMRDGLVGAVLAVIAVAPVAAHLARSAAEPLGVEARIVLAQEALGARAMAEGTLPFWNPYEFGGRPHLADPGTRAVYLPHLALRALPLHLIVPVSFWLHAWVAGLGAYLTARHLSASRVASFAASVAVMLAGVLAPAGEVPYVPGIYRVAWLPLILAFVLRSAERPRVLPHPGLVVVTALAMTASSRGPLDALLAVVACGVFVALWPPARATGRRLAAQFGLLASVTAGLTAFLLIPAAHLEASALAGAAVSDSPTAGSRHPHVSERAPLDPAVRTALGALDVRGRVLSACDDLVDSTHLIPLGLPAAGGTGGILSAEYARFTNLARGPEEAARPLYQGIREAGRESARDDLLRFMAVEYLVSCEAADSQRWAAVAKTSRVGVYRNLTAAPRAFWTCAPEAVGREELEYRLRLGTYDDRFTLHPNPMIHVRWPADMTSDDRTQIEAALHIVPQSDLGDRTWRYELRDPSPQNLTAIVTHPRVEDTQGIDRGSRVLMPASLPRFDEAKTDWLVGARPCDEVRPATVLRPSRVDGSMTVAVDAPGDGVVFLSETYDASRTVRLDGRLVEPLKVNFAFTGVPVTAGIHRIVLGYDATPFLIGITVSMVTLAAWGFGEWQARR